MKVFGYYHSADLDGQFSAAVMKKKYEEKDELKLWGFDYGDKDVPMAEGYDLVIMSDISMPIADMRKLKANNKKFVWIDHHSKTIRDMEKAGFVCDGLTPPDNQKSACVLTWEYLFPDKKVPEILGIVEDNDLWRFEVANSEIIYTSLDTIHKFELDLFTCLLDGKKFGELKSQIFSDGNLITLVKDMQINRAVKTAITTYWNGYNTGVVNTNLHQSKVGHEILERNKQIQVAMVWHADKGIVKVSLRSRGNVDVSKIASKYGGGGHRPASGFSVESLEEFLEIFED